MEYDMKAELERRFQQPREKVICLNIPDVYPRFDPWPARILKDKLFEYFQQEGLLP